MIRIKQDFKHIGENRWKWWAWIDGPDKELEDVESVTWVLHPTFYDPVRITRERFSKFRIETEGWGIFTLKAKVQLKDGQSKLLNHELVLKYPDGTKNMV